MWARQGFVHPCINAIPQCNPQSLLAPTEATEDPEASNGPALDGVRVRWTALRRLLLETAGGEAPASVVPAPLWSAAQAVALQHALHYIQRALAQEQDTTHTASVRGRQHACGVAVAQ